MWYFICIVIGGVLGLIFGYCLFNNSDEIKERVESIESYLETLISALKQIEKTRPQVNGANHNKTEAKAALKALGFSVAEIDKIVNNLPNNLSTDDTLKIALQLLGKG